MDQRDPTGSLFFVPIYYSDNIIMAVILPNQVLESGTKYNKCKYNISHQALFQTPLFEINIDDIDNRELEKNIYNLRDKEEGITLSNRGGWHSIIQSSCRETIDDTFKPVIDKLITVLGALPFDVTQSDNQYLTATATFKYVLFEVRNVSSQTRR